MTASPPPTPPGLEFAFEVRAEVGEPLVLGRLPTGTRRIIEIIGGRCRGPSLEGEVLRGGADWQLIEDDGFTHVDARYTLRARGGELIYVSNVGMRHASPETMAKLNAGEPVDPAEVYFRAVPRFETAAPELAWLMRSVFVAVGERYPKGVLIRFWRVL